MTAQFEHEGEWYLPDNPDRRIPGRLQFSGSAGGVLNLMGCLAGDPLKRRLHPEIILGDSNDGRRITLYKCREIHRSLTQAGPKSSAFSAATVFKGVHFMKPSAVRFRSLRLLYAHLDEWAQMLGFSWDGPDDAGMTLRYRLPKPVEARMRRTYKIRVEASYSWQAKGSEHTIRQTTHLTIDAPRGTRFLTLQSLSYKIENLLSLAVSEPTPRLSAEGITIAPNKASERTADSGVVEVFFRSGDYPQRQRELTPLDMLFTLPDIRDGFALYLDNWLRKADRLEPVLDLYVGTLLGSRMYLRHAFLSMIQAIEAYHRSITDKGELSEPAHKKRIARIQASAPEEDRRWLKRKLRFSNELSLPSRLNELWARCSGILDHFAPDREGFVKKAVDTRNYLSHYAPNLRERAATGKDLYFLTLRLKILLEACLLMEMGLKLDKIESLLLRNLRYQDVKEDR